MTDKFTIARPYAKAAFAYAVAEGQLKRWSDMLQTVAFAVMDPQMMLLLKNPQFTREQIYDLVLDICGKVLDEHGRNFIRLLIDNQRLTLMPEIATLYETYRAEYEKTITVQVTSVYPINNGLREKLTQVLQKRLQRKVSLECDIDTSLIGGAVIRAGDLVIDRSVRYQLAKLRHELEA